MEEADLFCCEPKSFTFRYYKLNLILRYLEISHDGF